MPFLAGESFNICANSVAYGQSSTTAARATAARVVTQPTGGALTPIVPRDEQTTGDDPCWENYYYEYSNNAFGDLLWKYQITVSWCSDGTWLTSTYHYETISTPGWWWSFNGDVQDLVLQGGVGYNGEEIYHEGHFQYCPYNLGCIQNQYPWVDETFYGDGSFYGSGGA